MPFPTALLILLVAYATAVAVLCLLAGLIGAAIPRFRRTAPYLALVCPAAYLGCLLGYVLAVTLNRWLFTGRQMGHWIIWAEFLFAVVATIVVGLSCGVAGLRLAKQMAGRIIRAGAHKNNTVIS